MGLSRLLCCSLDRQPSADVIEGTAQAWFTAATHGRTWDAERDAPRIEAAFDTLLATCRRWPSAPEFLDALPAFQPPQALPRPPADPEKVKAVIAEITKTLRVQ